MITSLQCPQVRSGQTAKAVHGWRPYGLSSTAVPALAPPPLRPLFVGVLSSSVELVSFRLAGVFGLLVELLLGVPGPGPFPRRLRFPSIRLSDRRRGAVSNVSSSALEH